MLFKTGLKHRLMMLKPLLLHLLLLLRAGGRIQRVRLKPSTEKLGYFFGFKFLTPHRLL